MSAVTLSWSPWNPNYKGYDTSFDEISQYLQMLLI